MNQGSPQVPRTVRLDLVDGPLVADVWEASAGAPPVLLLHGWGGTGRYWRPMIDQLAGRYRFIVPDLPGSGRSLPIHRTHAMPDQVVAIKALLDHLALDRVDIVAHSMGAGMAILLAAAQPDLIGRLVLTSVSLARNNRERYLFMGITQILALALWARFRWMAGNRLLQRLSARRYFYRLPDDPELLRAGFMDYLTMDRRTAVACARSAAGPDVPAAARKIQAPTLLVAGRQDHAMPTANVVWTAQVIPQCEVRWFERCGHLPMIEYASEYAAVVDAFLDRKPEPYVAQTNTASERINVQG